jgi:hypothetical protein
MMTFDEWYASLSAEDIKEHIKQKRGRGVHKQGWYEWFETVPYEEYCQDDREYDEYQEELNYMRRNRNVYG